MPANGTAYILPRSTAKIPTNPLKGFYTYAGSDTPTIAPSMEFFYIGMDDVADALTQPSNGDLGARLDDIARRGHQAIFRVVADYPGAKTTQQGIPPKLAATVKTFDYVDGGDKGTAYDYADPQLVAAIVAQIKDLGRALDGDARIAYIQVGYLGHWGEWHHIHARQLPIPPTTQARVLDAFATSFTRTKVAVSVDVLDPEQKFVGSLPGLHDDDVGNTVEAAYDFASQVRDKNLTDHWKESVVGGEVQPKRQCSALGSDEAYLALQKTITGLHFSSLLFYNLWEKEKCEALVMAESTRAKAISLADMMGYKLGVRSMSVSADGEIALEIANDGTAPFMSRWPVEIRIGTEIALTDWDVTKVMPGTPSHWVWRAAEALHGPKEVAIRVANPLSGGLPILFDNQVRDGAWVVLPTVSFGGDESCVAP